MDGLGRGCGGVRERKGGGREMVGGVIGVFEWVWSGVEGLGMREVLAKTFFG